MPLSEISTRRHRVIALARTLFVGFFGLWAGAATLSAAPQEPRREAPATFASGVGLVYVDVVVTDGRGNPVTSLPAGAFRLEDDDEPRKLVSFQAIDLRESEDVAPTPRRVSSNFGRARAPGRTFVLVFDDVHISPANAGRGRALLRAFLSERTRAGDTVVLVVPGEGLFWPVSIPAGRRQLLAIAESLTGRRRPGGTISEYESVQIANWRNSAALKLVRERLQASESPSQQEGREPFSQEQDRGAFSEREGRVPFGATGEVLRDQSRIGEIEARGRLEQAREGRRRTLAALASALEGLGSRRGRTSVVLVTEGFVYEERDQRFRDVIAAAQRARAAIYSLDIRGLTARGDVGSLAQAALPDRSPSTRREEWSGAELLAAETGGLAISRVNDFDDSLSRLTRDASQYYLLGFHPSPDVGVEEFRRVRVEVDRPGVVVHARKGYYGRAQRPAGATPGALSSSAALQQAVQALDPIGEIPIRLTTVTMGPAPDGRVETILAFEVAVSGLARGGSDGPRQTTLDLLMAINHVRPEGRLVVSGEGLVVSVPGDADVAETWLPLEQSLALPPGRCQVRFAVRERGSGAIGSVVHDVEIPVSGPGRVSSPILSDMPAREDGARPHVVARRSFGAGSVLYCYLEHYPEERAGAPDSLSIATEYEVVDGRGKLRHKAAVPHPVHNDDGSVGQLIEIPLTRMTPGDYELVVRFPDPARDLREPFTVIPPARITASLYRSVLSAYLDGEVQRAIATVLQWPTDQVLDAALGIPAEETGLRRAALMLHTDLLLLSRKYRFDTGAETHLRIGRSLLAGSDTGELRAQWLLALAHHHQLRSRATEALALYEECAEAYPDLAAPRLGAGTLHERTAFPGSFGFEKLPIPPRRAAREAERWYREALEIQPDLAEARLRLGRVYQETGRPDEAVEQLAATAATSDDDDVVALAHLFWGEVLRKRGKTGEASQHFATASKKAPDLQVAALAQARILYERGGREAVLEVLLPSLRRDRDDPSALWLAYHRGPVRFSEWSLAALRRSVLPEAEVPR